MKNYLVFLLIVWCFNLSYSGENKSVIVFTSQDSIRLENTIKFFKLIGEDHLDKDVSLILADLERKFKINIFDHKFNPDINQQKLLLRSIWVYDPNLYWESASPATRDSIRFLLSKEYNRIKIDAFTIHACLCNKIPLPEDYFQLLDMKIKMGGYELTHAALQYRNLFINGCITEEQYNNKRDIIASLIISKVLFGNPAYETLIDLKIEGAAFLFYLKSPLVYSNDVQYFINNLAQYQDSSGGWISDVGGRVLQHSSLMALWLFLEMKETYK
ncbi:MAG: hypothetical protein IT271_01305 [Chitinophagales bacterium]|nr:hypothetical protein [Chitinophagales bacterium]